MAVPANAIKEANEQILLMHSRMQDMEKQISIGWERPTTCGKQQDTFGNAAKCEDERRGNTRASTQTTHGTREDK